MTSTIATNMSVNSDDENVIYKIAFYILRTVLLVIIFLLIFTIICYRYAKHWSEGKNIDALTTQNGNNDFKKACIKNRTFCYFDDN